MIKGTALFRPPAGERGGTATVRSRSLGIHNNIKLSQTTRRSGRIAQQKKTPNSVQMRYQYALNLRHVPIVHRPIVHVLCFYYGQHVSCCSMYRGRRASIYNVVDSPNLAGYCGEYGAILPRYPNPRANQQIMPGTMRNAAIATGKKMTWNMNLEGTGPSKVVQSVVAEPSAAGIACSMSGSRYRLGDCGKTELSGR